MSTVYAKEEIPVVINKSIFLAGPTPRSESVISWRGEALKLLEKLGFDGTVFVPEPKNGQRWPDYSDQVEWEEKCLNIADCILFWVPRNMETMPALTTNVEFGFWMNSGKVVFGGPEEAEKNRYLNYYANKLDIPISSTLENTILNAIKMAGEGVDRTGGEREVPLYIWKTTHFQNWYSAQKIAGNRLDGAKVVWTFRVGPGGKFVFFWVLHVNVYIASENRNKTNEVVLSRPDVATIMMYKKNDDDFLNTDVVLIKEFRSPASNSSGFVWELAGGSSFKPIGDMKVMAVKECKEETGLSISPDRIKICQSRQLLSTLSAHKSHLFSVELTQDEIDWLISQQGVAMGVEEDTERTYVHVVKLKDILSQELVDWSNIGMIMSVISC